MIGKPHRTSREERMAQQPRKRLDAPPPQAAKVKSGRKNKKIANSLVALSSAAIISVYGLGYIRTDAAQSLYNIDAPTIPIATTAPTAMNPTPSPVAAYQSPLFPSPTATAATSDGSTQGAATTAAVQPTATTAAAVTSAPSAVASAPATATTVPPTATTAPLPRTTPPAATVASSATKAPATTALYKDGTYSGTGTSRHGNISASVVVQGGKIVSAAITQCGTRYPCSDIAALPGEVVARQSATVDAVSGATDSSQAYRGAIQNALAKAKTA
jgi:uncharacterized protein with FMN-binding domain